MRIGARVKCTSGSFAGYYATIIETVSLRVWKVRWEHNGGYYNLHEDNMKAV